MTSDAQDPNSRSAGQLRPAPGCPDVAEAAAYLAGDLDVAARARCEAHLMACEPCWLEIGAARNGRILAESLRVTAPQRLRETVRALAAESRATTVHAPGPPGACTGRRRIPRRLVGLAAGGLTAAALGVGFGLDRDATEHPRTHDDLLRAAVAVYTGAPTTASHDPAPVRQIGHMMLRSTRSAVLAGTPVTAFLYTDADGAQVLLLRSSEHFPRATGAYDLAAGPGWLGAVAGTAIFCPELPQGPSWLILAPSEELAMHAGRVAGLRA